DSAPVPIVPAHDFVVTNTERRAAAVAAMRANRPDVVHFPRPRLVTIDPAGERAHGANVDASAAFVALKMIVLVRNDLRDHSAIADAKRTHAHAFVTHAHAAITKDAARRIEVHNRRPLRFIGVNLALREPALARAVAEHHILEFALAALIAHRT